MEGVVVVRFDLPGPVAFSPARLDDDRGFFSEVYNRQREKDIGIGADFVQDNHTYSAEPGTIRGLHFQVPPHEQGKLVRVISGSVLDVVVDIRQGSPTFGRHLAIELSSNNWRQLWVPIGFAHGFCTLTTDVEVLYKVTAHFSAESDRGLAYDDADLAIAWPVDTTRAILSEKDRRHPRLKDLPAYFQFQAAEAGA